MKQTLLSRLILAGLAGAAMSAAQAGQIQASSVAIAREVITSANETIVSPTISYRFAGDVDARGQAQTFQVQFTLEKGEWDAANAPADLARAIKVTNSVTNATIRQKYAAAAPAAGTVYYTVDKVDFGNANKTLFATITVAQDAAAGLINQPLITINATTNSIDAAPALNTTADRASLTKLYAVTGDIVNDFTADNTKCSANVTLAVNFKHFTALTAPTTLATTGNATADEHTRGGTDNATLVVFPTNVLVSIAKSTNAAFLTAGGNLTFSNNTAGGSSYVSNLKAKLGTLTLVQNASGYDANLVNQYLLSGNSAVGSNLVGGLDDTATAVGVAGDVETKQVDIQVFANNGFSEGGTLFASTDNCVTSVGTVTNITAGNKNNASLTVTIGTAAVEAVFGVTGTGPVSICYGVTGTKVIPSSKFTAIGRVVKATGTPGEQDNICKGDLYSLGGGLKIDVRNYASSAETSGYQSVLRFINNSDNYAADVWAQFVHQDGKLGNWAKIADLPVRGVLNMTAAQIDAKLAAGSAATAVPGTAAPVAQAATATSSDTAPRLRITSTTGKSLRVQNYLFNSATGQILEGSGQQGVDFEGTATRATPNEGQYQDQDANSGLNLGN